MEKTDRRIEVNNRGMTLIELMIAIAMSVMIMTAATMFIGNAQKSYQSASESVNLQMEAQILMEQLGTWIMEGNRIAVNASELTIYDIPRKTATPLPAGVHSDEQASKRVVWISDGKLYMKVFTDIADPDADSLSVSAGDGKEENCIGLYVTGFTPAIDAANPAKIYLKLELEQGSQKYEVENEIMVRNQIV